MSQTAVVGIAFNHFVFSKVFPNCIRIEFNKPSEIMQKDTGTARKVFLIIILSVMVLIASGRIKVIEEKILQIMIQEINHSSNSSNNQYQ
jgi:hypothetical protein